jgi:NAD(P)-dependent dehydrogenase (short-subunit alcohol dehydrogenase family)
MLTPRFPVIPEYCGAKAAVINFVRTMAPVLKVKENITINAVCPGIVETPIIPPEMIAAVSREWQVPLPSHVIPITQTSTPY